MPPPPPPPPEGSVTWKCSVFVLFAVFGSGRSPSTDAVTSYVPARSATRPKSYWKKTMPVSWSLVTQVIEVVPVHPADVAGGVATRRPSGIVVRIVTVCTGPSVSTRYESSNAGPAIDVAPAPAPWSRTDTERSSTALLSKRARGYGERRDGKRRDSCCALHPSLAVEALREGLAARGHLHRAGERLALVGLLRRVEAGGETGRRLRRAGRLLAAKLRRTADLGRLRRLATDLDRGAERHRVSGPWLRGRCLRAADRYGSRSPTGRRLDLECERARVVRRVRVGSLALDGGGDRVRARRASDDRPAPAGLEVGIGREGERANHGRAIRAALRGVGNVAAERQPGGQGEAHGDRLLRAVGEDLELDVVRERCRRRCERVPDEVHLHREIVGRAPPQRTTRQGKRGSDARAGDQPPGGHPPSQGGESTRLPQALQGPLRRARALASRRRHGHGWRRSSSRRGRPSRPPWRGRSGPGARGSRSRRRARPPSRAARRGAARLRATERPRYRGSASVTSITARGISTKSSGPSCSRLQGRNGCAIPARNPSASEKPRLESYVKPRRSNDARLACGSTRR